MTDLLPPRVPDLDEAWIAARWSQLAGGLGDLPLPNRTRRRVLAVSGTVGASGLAAVIGLVTIGSTPAFAGWTLAPTAPSNGQVAAAETACQNALMAASSAQPSKPGVGAVSATSPQLVDTRGPFTVLLLAGTDNAVSCLSGPSFTSIGGTSSVGAATPGAISLGRVSFTARDGQPYTLAEGTVGAGVTGVTLGLSDGSQVVTTTSNGDFAAWWPGSSGIASAQVMSPTGTVTQPLNVSGPQGGTSPTK
jgi:hypothetical protein